ncbi:MAG: hypothetical protein JNK05_36585 [Myxococcales bacterium]|nr:hypothetical protein [Myxococcales bacterium]
MNDHSISPSSSHRRVTLRTFAALCAIASTAAAPAAMAQQQPNELAPMTIQANPAPEQPAQPQPQPVQPLVVQAPLGAPPPLGNAAPLEIQSTDPSLQLVYNAANNMPQHMQPRGAEPLAPCAAPCNRPVARDEIAYVISPNSRPSTSFLVNQSITRLLVEPVSRGAYDGMAVMRTTGFIVGGLGLFGGIYTGYVALLTLPLTPSSPSTDGLRTVVYSALGVSLAMLVGGGILGVYGQVSLGNMHTRVYDQNRQRLARRPAVQWIGNGILF